MLLNTNANKIVWSDQDAGFGQVGGGAFLEDIALWPLAPSSGKMMTPLITLREHFLPVRFLPEGMALTVFIAVDARDGTFDSSIQHRYTVNLQSELEEVRQGGYSRVLLHKLSEQALWPTSDTVVIPPKFIDFVEMTDAEVEADLEDDRNGLGISKPVGRRFWLQDAIGESNRYSFLMQLMEYDIAEWSPVHAGLIGRGVGYLYVDRQARRGKQGDEGGYFFIQPALENCPTRPAFSSGRAQHHSAIPAYQRPHPVIYQDRSMPETLNPNKIVFSDQDAGLGQVGGGAFLEDIALWPRVPDTGQLMTPLMTLSERFLPEDFVPKGMAISVFIAVKERDGYFNESVQRRYTAHQQSELQEVIERGYSRVILHTLSKEALLPSSETMTLPSQFIHFRAMSEEELAEEVQEEDCGLELSKPQGRAGWLQDPIFPPEHHSLLMQLSEYDIAQWSPAHEGLFVDGIGYLYLDERVRQGQQGDEAGYFFIQFT